MLGIFRMGQTYFAFYWTFPVPWVGFTSLPGDLDEAAAASRTIRYSRQKARAHVAHQGGTMAPEGEVAIIELAPDRGSPEIGDAFRALLDKAATCGAKVVIVDFSGHNGWRGHQYLNQHYDDPCCEVVRAAYEDVHLTGINPYDHFEKWRDRTREKIAAKPDHRAAVLDALAEIDGVSFPARAVALNALGLRTHGGKLWTGDNLRKFLQG
jgi:hypothetical protein